MKRELTLAYLIQLYTDCAGKCLDLACKSQGTQKRQYLNECLRFVELAREVGAR